MSIIFNFEMIYKLVLKVGFVEVGARRLIFKGK